MRNAKSCFFLLATHFLAAQQVYGDAMEIAQEPAESFVIAKAWEEGPKITGDKPKPAWKEGPKITGDKPKALKQEELKQEAQKQEIVVVEEEPAQPPFASFTGKVIKNKVRLRLHPTLDSPIIRELNQGELLGIVGESEDFYAAQPPSDVKAYIYRTYVLDGVVEGNHVNVRLLPDLSAPIIAQMNSGEPVVGAVNASDKKWIEMTPPANTKFFIAKEYIQKAGDIHMVTTLKKRHSEAVAILNNAKITSQIELQHPFELINLDKVEANLNRLISHYSDFPEEVTKAKELLASIQTAYLKKKVSHIETVSNSNLQPQIHIEHVAEEIHEEIHPTKHTHVLNSTMAVWGPVESSIYEAWAAIKENPTEENFYHEQIENAIVIRGILEPYTRIVKNKPGDYILLRETDRQPIAFLYSTQVNLEDKVGLPVELQVFPRNNYNFAYPAYFVLGIHE